MAYFVILFQIPRVWFQEESAKSYCCKHVMFTNVLYQASANSGACATSASSEVAHEKEKKRGKKLFKETKYIEQ